MELRASGAVGLRWQAVFGCQIVWNRLTRQAGARGGVRVDRPRWLVSACSLNVSAVTHFEPSHRLLPPHRLFHIRRESMIGDPDKQHIRYSLTVHPFMLSTLTNSALTIVASLVSDLFLTAKRK